MDSCLVSSGGPRPQELRSIPAATFACRLSHAAGRRRAGLTGTWNVLAPEGRCATSLAFGQSQGWVASMRSQASSHATRPADAIAGTVAAPAAVFQKALCCTARLPSSQASGSVCCMEPVSAPFRSLEAISGTQSLRTHISMWAITHRLNSLHSNPEL
ncbi:hypothetical protein FKP32DRAFT_974615 [Trametes sanguinea]|nr:hypothetical protein FKP32DRAFT_974615 [Trametes sanguinea]